MRQQMVVFNAAAKSNKTAMVAHHKTFKLYIYDIYIYKSKLNRRIAEFTSRSSASLSALPVFLGTVSLKDTLSGRTLQCLRSREAKAEIRSGQVNANRVTNFIFR